jgi:hypothetical protein
MKDFGMKCNEVFYLRSRLPMKRVVEMHGNANVWLRRWRKNAKGQQWMFDCTKKVIRNNQWKNYVLEIQGNGRSNNLRTSATINSRWW